MLYRKRPCDSDHIESPEHSHWLTLLKYAYLVISIAHMIIMYYKIQGLSKSMWFLSACPVFKFVPELSWNVCFTSTYTIAKVNTTVRVADVEYYGQILSLYFKYDKVDEFSYRISWDVYSNIVISLA